MKGFGTVTATSAVLGLDLEFLPRSACPIGSIANPMFFSRRGE